MLVARTSSASETRALAGALAALAVPGDLLLLTGDLAAGKTTFTQGFGAALGVTEPITSPTFTLHHRYEGRVVLNHLDVYRIDQLDEVADLALDELVDGDAVTVIEWGDVILPELPPDHLEVHLTLGEGDDDRLVELTVTGPRWAPRRRVLEEALAPWRGPQRPEAPC